VSRIFFSSLISTKSSVFSIAPRLLDEKVFSLRGLIRGLTNADGAKLVGLFFLVFGWGLFLL
jgi:hypothetical protein